MEGGVSILQYPINLKKRHLAGCSESAEFFRTFPDMFDFIGFLEDHVHSCSGQFFLLMVNESFIPFDENMEFSTAHDQKSQDLISMQPIPEKFFIGCASGSISQYCI